MGDFTKPDEARKVIAQNLFKELSKSHEVAPFDTGSIASFEAWRRVRSFAPEVLCYVPGASNISFAVTKLMKIWSHKPRTVMFSALNAFQGASHGLYYVASSLTKDFTRFIKTDLVLVQSRAAEEAFSDLGCRVQFFVCSGVDVQKFRPVSEKIKGTLREAHSIDDGAFVVLHVGSIRRWRNVDLLKSLQKNEDVQVVLVGRPSQKNELALKLRRSGIKTICNYDSKIEEIYALSDCYVFPTVDPLGSIDVPLSVLEAMATDLPVISTRFGGLPEVFKEGDGLVYSDSDHFEEKLKETKDGQPNVRTRDKVMPYSWQKVARGLQEIFEKL